MKTVAFCLLVALFACFPALAQTNLNGDLLVVFDDINSNPNQFVDNQDIRTIVIDRSTRNLPENAFVGTSARNLTFAAPSSIRVIPNGVFSENYNLALVQLFDPNNSASLITTIGEFAFAGCNRLQRIRLPPSLVEIQFAAFSSTGITRLYIPDSVEYIGPSILYNTNTIASVRLPANADVHENNPFYRAYEQNEKKAGVYLRFNETWIFGQDRPEEEYYNMP